MLTTPWMEVLSPSFSSNSGDCWILQQGGGGGQKSMRAGGGGGGGNYWTHEENKLFENALAYIDSRTPDRFERVAALFPGKTVRDVIDHFRDLVDDVSHIEAGLVAFPGYTSDSLSFDLDAKHRHSYCVVGGKRGRFSDHERKKGVPWTEDEHKLFLMGLSKHGKGDWRNISRNFVVTRTPTQVASHAQKYFNRINSGTKDKRRASIHDITLGNLSLAVAADNNQPCTRLLQPSSAL